MKRQPTIKAEVKDRSETLLFKTDFRIPANGVIIDCDRVCSDDMELYQHNSPEKLKHIEADRPFPIDAALCFLTSADGARGPSRWRPFWRRYDENHRGEDMSEKAIMETVLRFYPEAEAIYLFGTCWTPHERHDSDVDIALLFSPGRAKAVGSLVMGGCMHALEDAVKRTVDMVNLRMANTVFQNEIIQEGRIIYKQNEAVVDEFEMQAMSAYQKLSEERARILEDIFATGRILQ